MAKEVTNSKDNHKQERHRNVKSKYANMPHDRVLAWGHHQRSPPDTYSPRIWLEKRNMYIPLHTSHFKLRNMRTAESLKLGGH